MRIDILTLFPEMFKGPLDESMIKIAKKKNLLDIRVHNLRKWTSDIHRTADDKPYGGGSGMIMKLEPIYMALVDIRREDGEGRVILLSPQGTKLKQHTAKRLSKEGHLILICGHYEGVDERVRALINEEISIGDYVLTCGELPACVLVDCVARLLPGVLGDPNSVETESFEHGLLEYPQYTRPRVYKGMKVPDVILSGDHKKIDEWRKKEAVKRTKEKRPDLFRRKSDKKKC